MTLIKLSVSIFLLTNFLAQAQMVPYITRDEFDWKTWETVKDEEGKLRLITQIEDLENFGDSLSPIEARRKHFKAIDIDADGFPDLVYNGPQGTAKPAVIFYKNKGGQFRKIFHQTGDLIYVSREKPWNPISFQIIQKVSHENSELQICSHSFKNGELRFVLDNTIIIRNGLKVIKENLPPMLFEVDQEHASLRTSSVAERTNGIKDYGHADIGFAVGSEMNSLGEIWWFVFMKEEGHKLRAGWMNSQEIKKL